ncbi:MAG: O-antigen ligase family protein [Bryobacteraceae bacterium]
MLFSPLVAIGAIEAVIAMLQRANQDFDELSTGTFASHASLSCFLCAVLPLSAFVGSQLFAIGNRKLASIFAIESVLVAGGVLASFSRVGWLFLGFFAVATAVRHAKTHRLTAVVATAIFAGVVFFSMSPQYLESRLGRLNSWSGLRHDLNVNRWGSALQLFAKAPTFGHGAGAFPVAYSVYIGRKKGDEVPEVPSAENDYLQMLAELGLTGSVLLCGLAISFLRQVRLDVRASDAVTREFLWAAAASLGAVGLHCLLDRQITRPAIAFEVAWICGLIVACGGGSLRKYPT